MAHLKTAFAAARRRQGRTHRTVHSIEDIAFPRKADFRFGRVHVDIHKICRHFQHEHSPGKFALHHRALVGIFESRHHRAVLDVTAIHKEMLCAAAGAAGARRRDQTCDMVKTAAAVDRQQVPGKFPPQHGVHRTAQIAIPGVRYCCLPSRKKRKLISGCDKAA